MTKHLPDEAALKCHVDVADVAKVGLGVSDVLEKNALALGGAGFGSVVREDQVKPKLVHMRTRVSSFKTRLGRIMQKLYDLEQDAAPEKPLNVDLGVDLYQMEDY